jgi:hypothetical protein
LQSLIYFFFELCLLRRAPQELPASTALLGMALAADLLSGMLLSHSAGVSAGVGLAESLVDVVLMLSLLYGGLSGTQHSARFVQAATALLGTSALLGVFATVPLGFSPTDPQGQGSPLAAILFLGMIGWGVLVTGHIVRHAFDLNLGQGVAIAVVYNFALYWLVGAMFSGT